jgi:hypothetical protein
MEVEANDTLPFLDILAMKRGPKLTIKLYWKPTHTSYLHFKSFYPHHVKRGVVHSFISRAKVMCQNQKDFNKGIINIRYDLMVSEYPQEFVHSIMKLSRSNHLSSNTIYQGAVIIPYVNSIS